MFTTTVTVPASIGVIGPAASLAGFQYGTALTVQLPSTAGPSDVVQFYGANIPDATRLSQLVPLNGIDIPAPGESAQQPSSSTSIAANYSHLYAVRVAGTSGALAAAIAGATEPASGGGSSGVASVGAGTSIAITGSAQNPVVNYSGAPATEFVYQEGGVAAPGRFTSFNGALAAANAIAPFPAVIGVDGFHGQPVILAGAHSIPSALVVRSVDVNTNFTLDAADGAVLTLPDNVTFDGIVVLYKGTTVPNVEVVDGQTTTIFLKNGAAIQDDPSATQPFAVIDNGGTVILFAEGGFPPIESGGLYGRVGAPVFSVGSDASLTCSFGQGAGLFLGAIVGPARVIINDKSVQYAPQVGGSITWFIGGGTLDTTIQAANATAVAIADGGGAVAIGSWATAVSFPIGVFNNTTGIFTAPVAGFYLVSCGLEFAAEVAALNAEFTVSIFINGVQGPQGVVTNQVATLSAKRQPVVSQVIQLAQGGTIGIRASQSSGSGAGALTGNSVRNYLSITYTQGASA